MTRKAPEWLGPIDLHELQRVRIPITAFAAIVLLAPPIVTGVRERAESAALELENEIALSRKLIEAGRALESLVVLQRAQRIDPDVSDLHNNLCVAYGILKRKDEAVAACGRALELEPGNGLAKNNLAWVQSL